MDSGGRMESFQKAACTVKAPVYLSIGHHDTTSDGQSSSRSQRDSTDSGAGRISGCQVIEVQLHQPMCISLIRFRNNYTYCISVLYLSALAQKEAHAAGTLSDIRSRGRTAITGGDWKVGVADHLLMESCHCDSPSAQTWVELGKETFQGKLEDVVKLRLILRQPSPHWRDFGIESLTCYHDITASSSQQQGDTRPSSLSRDQQGEWSSWNSVEKLLEVGRTAHLILKSEKEGTVAGSQDQTGSNHHIGRGLPYEVNLLSN